MRIPKHSEKKQITTKDFPLKHLRSSEFWGTGNLQALASDGTYLYNIWNRNESCILINRINPKKNTSVFMEFPNGRTITKDVTHGNGATVGISGKDKYLFITSGNIVSYKISGTKLKKEKHYNFSPSVGGITYYKTKNKKMYFYGRSGRDIYRYVVSQKLIRLKPRCFSIGFTFPDVRYNVQ